MKKQTRRQLILRTVMLFLGSVLAAAGLEFFLVPNQIIDGGIVGLSIMASYLSGFPLSAFVITLNIPFLYLGYKKIGRSFAVSTLFAILSLSYWLSVFHPLAEVTHDLFLAAVFGGIILGLGVGLIIRYGGSLDGTEIIAILLDRRTGFSVGEIIMMFNLFILGSSGFILGWDKAMYSLVTYFIAFKMIDITIQGVDESKGVFIVSDQHQEIAAALMEQLGRGVTVFNGEGGFSGETKKILYSVITRLEIARLKAIVDEIDDTAFVTIQDVYDVVGGMVKKKPLH